MDLIWQGFRRVYWRNYFFGNIGVEIPTYVRNGNSTLVYQVDAANTVTNEERLNNFLGSNRGELQNNDWLSIGYIPGGVNTSGG